MPPKSKKIPSTKKSSVKKRKNSQKKKTFNTYIIKVLKQVHPDLSIGEKEGVPMVNSMLEHVVRKIAHATSLLLRRAGKHTVTSREIQTSVRLIFPGELAKHAVSEGVKAVTKYNATHASGGGGPNFVPKPAEGKQSKASRAGLVFSVSRTSKIFYPYVQGINIRKGGGAAVYLAAVLEYLAAEILEHAGNTGAALKKKSIKPRHIVLAIQTDEELDYMYKRCVLQGGIIPHIHSSLIKKKKGKTSE